MPEVDSHPCMFSPGKRISSTFGWIIAELWTGHQRYQRMEMSFSPVAHLTSGTKRLAGNPFLWSIMLNSPTSPRFSLLLVFHTKVKVAFLSGHPSAWKIGFFLIFVSFFNFFTCLLSIYNSSCQGLELATSSFFCQVFNKVGSITVQHAVRTSHLPLK